MTGCQIVILLVILFSVPPCTPIILLFTLFIISCSTCLLLLSYHAIGQPSLVFNLLYAMHSIYSLTVNIFNLISLLYIALCSCSLHTGNWGILQAVERLSEWTSLGTHLQARLFMGKKRAAAVKLDVPLTVKDDEKAITMQWDGLRCVLSCVLCVHALYCTVLYCYSTVLWSTLLHCVLL